ncbi:NAD-dependent epimerase/dehydratase family protein [Modestobacter sp. Leaf380]|uniref:NAD-dependent epimerase/dehydratase family protein n=1 Tax=Modestobacter sp. Leaf380 TaxID=1736356 RepID=UPI0006F575CC|nr:NAD-dependent epimerase/dehydratase family protein [Modestobacter sp. Leaf380]KQS73652.1 epimerase [Modestobacter sp. Leaf380]
MGLHVVVGKGPVGTAVSGELVRAGHRVRVLSRSGGTSTDDVEHRAVDAADTEALATASAGADVVYNAVNPTYHRWATEWPPIATALLGAAERSGAVLVAMGNLYGHGRPTGPMTARSPLAATDVKGRVRVAMWEQMAAAHEAGRVRVTEARASDFVGPDVPPANSYLGRSLAGVRAGGRVWVIGDPDVQHSWAYLPDVGATLATLGTDERAWGRAWVVPSAPSRSQREALGDFAAVFGAPAPRVSSTPWPVLRALGTVVPLLREVVAIRHQWDADFVVDGSETTAVLGVAPTPWDQVVRTTAGALPG